MLDLETLDTRPTSMILSVGAVTFDKHQIYEKFYSIVKLSNNTMGKFTVSADTLSWWFLQLEALREFSNPSNSLEDTLFAFKDFYKSCECEALWGNGSRFDNTILENAYDVMGIEKPWSYRHDMCYRTIVSRFPKLDIPFNGTRHSAINDAEYQAQYLIALNSKYSLNIL